MGIKNWHKGIITLALIAFGIQGWSQKSDLGAWYMYMGDQRIQGRWHWWNEVQYRDYQMMGDIEQLLLRTAISYDLSENNNALSLGYGYIHSENYTDPMREIKDQKSKDDEHRIYQQFFTKQKFGRFYLNHRFRFEQRFINAQSTLKYRLRYFLQFRAAITKPKLEKGCLYFSAYNEIFVTSPSFEMDRMRTYTAAGYQLTPNLKLEAGVMYQNVIQDRGRTQLQVLLINSLPFKKKSKDSTK
ncbi:DUF2490 domain-containing protein [bacterium SCSIO 12741]|nr:DUF2490 domain-containing protein [bacterium SCSIO 12741]